MSFRTKQLVDFWLGGLFLMVLFLPVRGLGLMLRRDHSLATRRGCAVIKLVGAGSLFLAMPSLQAIRGRFPEGRFFLVSTRPVSEFADDFGWFDECWVIDDTSLFRLIRSTFGALGKIAWYCDHLIDLEVHSRLTTVFGVLSMVRNRIGFVDEIVFWRRGFYTHMTYFNPQGPVYAFYDMLADWFDVKKVAVRSFVAAFRARVLLEPSAEWLELPARYVVVGPGCSNFGRERQLFPPEWRTLLRQSDIAPADVLLLGGPADTALCAALVAELGAGRDLSGRLSILQSAKVLAGAAWFFGIDSLLLHLARALDVPSVSVWGPSDPATRLRPSTAEERVFFAGMSCSPCIHVHETPPCKGARDCIPAALATQPMPWPANAVGAAQVAVGWATGPGDRTVRSVRVLHD